MQMLWHPGSAIIFHQYECGVYNSSIFLAIEIYMDRKYDTAGCNCRKTFKKKDIIIMEILIFFGNYSIKTTRNQYYYGKNSKNLIYFSILRRSWGLRPRHWGIPHIAITQYYLIS
jgi:hypothetical protein